MGPHMRLRTREPMGRLVVLSASSLPGDVTFMPMRVPSTTLLYCMLKRSYSLALMILRARESEVAVMAVTLRMLRWLRCAQYFTHTQSTRLNATGGRRRTDPSAGLHVSVSPHRLCFIWSVTPPSYFPCAGHSFQCLTQAPLCPPHHNPKALAQGGRAGTVDPSRPVTVCTWPCYFSVDQQCKVPSALCCSPSSPPSP